jgi:hypothetical protein
MHAPRSAGALGTEFPYTLATMCYIQTNMRAPSASSMTSRGRAWPTMNTKSVGVSQYEDKTNGAYITIDVGRDCGCEIHDLPAFAKQMRVQKGWDVATTSGWGGSSGGGERSYYMRARGPGDRSERH